MKTLTDLFKNGSSSFKKANPKLVALDKNREIKTNPGSFSGIPEAFRMNKTEAMFLFRLNEAKRKGEISRWIYEGVTLRWADMKYTPDFVVFPSFPGALPMMIEVKGGFIRDRDIVRFKGCRAAWPEFGFQMWQYKNKQWRKKY